MERAISCEFNLDTACVELKFADGSMISIDTVAVENEVADNMYQRSELDWLIYNQPLEYANAVLNGGLEKYIHGTPQDIFNSCVEVFSQRMEKIRNDMRLPETNGADFSYQTVSTEKLVDVATALFLFYLQDDVAAKFRKMLMIERYHNPEINKLFEDLFIKGVIEHEEKIFSDLIDAKVIKGDNPHIIALRFYTPIFYLLQKYDMHSDKVEEAKQELSLIVREFCDTYKGSGK